MKPARIISNIDILSDLNVIQTCGACPEQYDVETKTGERVGYLRLRHGWFYAACPDVGGEVVYEAPTQESDGAFTEKEYAIHMPRALISVYIWCYKNGKL